MIRQVIRLLSQLLSRLLLRLAMRSESLFLRLATRTHSGLSGGRTTSIQSAVDAAASILVVSLAEIGDAILLSSFLRELRVLAPFARIVLVSGGDVAPLFEACPHIDELLVYNHKAPRLLRPFVLPLRARSFAKTKLHSRDFDIAVVPRWDTDHHMATLVSWFSRARRRVAYSERVNSRKEVLNAGFDALITDVIDDSRAIHEVEHHMDVLRFLGSNSPTGILELWTTADDEEVAESVLPRARSGTGPPLIALGIGAVDPKRRWPPENFIEVGIALRAHLNARIVVIGAKSDAAAQAAIVHGIGEDTIPLAGRLTLRQSAAVLKRCQLFVGNDSGPVHLAAASGIPCVAISCHPIGADPRHNNAPERFGPWGVPARILRPPKAAEACASACEATTPHCILGVTPAAVLAAVEVLLPSVSIATA